MLPHAFRPPFRSRRRSRARSRARRSARRACRPRPRSCRRSCTRERAPKRPTIVAPLSLSQLGEALGAGVLGELAHVLGDGRRGVDLEVHHDLGAERLRERDLALKPLVLATRRAERGVLEVLGPDAEDDVRALVTPSAPAVRPASPRRARSAGRRRPRRGSPPPRSSCRLDEVHRRAADEAADEEVDRAGRRAPAARRPAAARPSASPRRGRPSSSPRSGRA